MKKNRIVFSMLALALAGLASAQSAPPTKIAIIHVQNAILQTRDGQKAQKELESKFNPRKQAIDKKQADIANLQEQMKKGSATMSDEAKNRLARDIDSSQKSLQRDSEDFEADVNQDEQRIVQDLGEKMMDIVIKYASQHGFAMVVDVSNPQSSVLWADPSTDITNDIVKLYDQAHPPAAAAPAAPARPAAAPTPAPARPTPAVPPTPAKKQ